MNFQQLLSHPDLDIEELQHQLELHYGDPKFPHPVTYNLDSLLSNLKNIKVKPNHEQLLLYFEFVPEDGELYAECYALGLDGDHYDISLTPWEHTLGYEVDLLLEDYVSGEEDAVSLEEAVAHVLAEITFYGVDESSIERLLERLRSPQESFELKDVELELPEEDRYIPRAKRIKEDD